MEIWKMVGHLCPVTSPKITPKRKSGRAYPVSMYVFFILMDVIPVTFACLLAGKYDCEGRNRKCCK